MNLLFLRLLDFQNLKENNIYTDLLRYFVKQGHNVSVISPKERRFNEETRLITEDNCKILKLKIGNIQKTGIIEKGISTVLLESRFKSGVKKYFSDIKNSKYDGMIITGAPVENFDFEEVDYWDEICEIMEWSKTHVTSTFHICWAAQAGLYYHYGIPKYSLPQKCSGVYKHKVKRSTAKIVRGFDTEFYAPHSRHTEVRAEDIKKVKELEILAESEEAGVYIIFSKGGRQIFVTGHSEYDATTLADEYKRDVDKGLNPNIPENYFQDDNPKKQPIVRWRSHANLLFSNWLNYFVYQITPYDIDRIK